MDNRIGLSERLIYRTLRRMNVFLMYSIQSFGDSHRDYLLYSNFPGEILRDGFPLSSPEFNEAPCIIVRDENFSD